MFKRFALFVYFCTKRRMDILENISLKQYNTFGMDYKASCIVSIRTEKEAISLFSRPERLKAPLLVLGGGSNILFTGDFKGTIIHPEIGNVKIEKMDAGNVMVSAGSGIPWDRFVEWSVARGLYGIENLSLIPGHVGAVPVQNIGAYGVEVKDTIESVRTISMTDGIVRIFTNKECEFKYRDSIFKNKEKGRYLVTRVFFRLTTNPYFKLDYGSLKEEVEKTGKPSLRAIREAVMSIRRKKLPDPSVTGNAGSFFKNPVIKPDTAEELKKIYPGIPCHKEPSGDIKLAAAWLIDQCGWKGKREGGAGVHENQPLVLVNYGDASGKEVYDLSEMIKASVFRKFRIMLEREVEVI